MAGLVAALAGGFLVLRSRVKAAWNEEAGTLALDTQAAVATRLPPVLTGVTTRQRSMSYYKISRIASWSFVEMNHDTVRLILLGGLA